MRNQRKCNGMDYDFDWVPPAPSPEPEKSSLDEDARDQAVAEFQERIRLAEMTFGLLSPPPPPEKSPLDKALEDFVAKRKAKRERNFDGPFEIEIKGFTWIYNLTEEERVAEALDRAMRRLSFHEQDIHTRLMPYRREE